MLQKQHLDYCQKEIVRDHSHNKTKSIVQQEEHNKTNWNTFDLPIQFRDKSYDQRPHSRSSLLSGSVLKFVRKPIAICVIPGGCPDPLSPIPSRPTHDIVFNIIANKLPIKKGKQKHNRKNEQVKICCQQKLYP